MLCVCLPLPGVIFSYTKHRYRSSFEMAWWCETRPTRYRELPSFQVARHVSSSTAIISWTIPKRKNVWNTNQAKNTCWLCVVLVCDCHDASIMAQSTRTHTQKGELKGDGIVHMLRRTSIVARIVAELIVYAFIFACKRGLINHKCAELGCLLITLGILRTCALRSRHIRTRLEAEQQPAVLRATLDVRHGIHALAVTAIVRKRVRSYLEYRTVYWEVSMLETRPAEIFTSKRTLNRLCILLEQTVEQGIACDLFAERLQGFPALAIVWGT